ncbi:hypothetical protein TraAM80_01058 [Trypanosoma rangeli]|uniref:Uncharacterized protein n=1 Tax=Trypanosoma rangeli TaxID=5698 RepID=A0A3R7RRD6_TRYRA|nr:uncharacterized protein TraAM80_01058 [Trypanosoma rangeli]RNF11269.1 hypothetical protein TraAM80_01058 [Trypanosoma rangeli]|eukprot:RNF11269.1 hypothetical protein TraAM80_01058 [Trypanosoma rangeli]
MEVGSYQEMIAAAKQSLSLVSFRANAAGAEQERKEALLRQLRTTLDERQREKECVQHRTCEISADTATILNKLRAIEELDMLDSMLVEKNKQLYQQQYRHDTLLQQLANIETILDEASLEGKLAGSTIEAQSAQCVSCCEHLRRCIAAADRYCDRHTSHVLSHPVSVIHKSIRNMCRMVRERDERLIIQLEDVDTQQQHAASLDHCFQKMEATYTCEMEELRRSNQDMIQAITQSGEAEIKSLREGLQRAVEARQHLLRRLKDERRLPVEGELPPLLVEMCSAEDDSCEGVGSSPLRSVPILGFFHPVGPTPRSTTAVVMSSRNTNNNDEGENVTRNDADGTENAASVRNIPAVLCASKLRGSSLCHGVGPTQDVIDSEMEELEYRAVAAERDVDRMQQRYETLEEEAELIRHEYAKKQKVLEEKLSRAQEAVSVLAREKSEWQALHQQMSHLIS